MRAIIVPAVTSALVTGLLAWHQYRNVFDGCYLSFVNTEQERMVEARKVEQWLREGNVDEALAYLQTSRDLRVIRVADIKSTIDIGSWRFSRDENTLKKAEAALREESEYRQINGESNSDIGGQARRHLDALAQ